MEQYVLYGRLLRVFDRLPAIVGIFIICLVTSAPVWADITINLGNKNADTRNALLEENILAHIGDIDDAEYKNPRLLERRLNGLITEALQAVGYYHAEWSFDIQSKNLLITLNAGPPVLLRKPFVDIIGPASELTVFTSLISESQLITGAVLDHSDYDALKKQLMQRARSLGFFDAKYLSSELVVDVRINRADIKLILESGERYQFGEVTFTGGQLSDVFLSKMVPFNVGEDYNSELLAEFRRDLNETGYFSQVTVTPTHVLNGTKRQVDFQVNMEDNSQHQFEVGFGFDTDNGPRVRLNWDMPIIGEVGHAWRSKLEVSKPLQEVKGTYRIPLSEPLNHFLLFNSGFTHQKIETTESSLADVGVFRLNLKEDNWQHRYGVSVDYERYRQGSGEDSDEWREVFYMVPGIDWMKTDLEKGGDPSWGYRFYLAFEGSATALGSDTNFFKGQIGARWLTSLGDSSFRLLSRANFGAIDTSSILDVPVSRRFYTGGDQTIRGYEYNAVATRDDEGELVGGRYLNVLSLELSGRVTDRWRAAVFADTGRAYNDLDEPFSSSVGLGARWISLIGEVRVDLAHPLDNDAETPVRLHVSMGSPL